MIAMYFKYRYRTQIRKYFEKWDIEYNSLSFNAGDYSVYYVKNNKVYCELETLFTRKYPTVKIIDPEEIYGEY